MRAQSMNLPFPSAWGHSIVKKIADHARRGYAAGRLSAHVFYRFDILTIRPTVDTKYPLAQKCWPTKLRFCPPYTRAKCIALLPLINPTTCDTAYFGRIDINMCT